jgi:hypothetical protein
MIHLPADALRFLEPTDLHPPGVAPITQAQGGCSNPPAPPPESRFWVFAGDFSGAQVPQRRFNRRLVSGLDAGESRHSTSKSLFVRRTLCAERRLGMTCGR